MNVNFQPLKAHLQHSKVHQMFPIIQICLLLSLSVLIHAPAGYSMHTKYAIYYIKLKSRLSVRHVSISPFLQ